MEKQIFELSKHGKDLRIHIENMNRLDVMASLSSFLRGLVDRKILDEEDIRLRSEEMEEGMRDDKRFS